nr:MAG TPA: hypothetical protein [Caudoviricetes sp.]
MSSTLLFKRDFANELQLLLFLIACNFFRKMLKYFHNIRKK